MIRPRRLAPWALGLAVASAAVVAAEFRTAAPGPADPGPAALVAVSAPDPVLPGPSTPADPPADRRRLTALARSELVRNVAVGRAPAAVPAGTPDPAKWLGERLGVEWDAADDRQPGGVLRVTVTGVERPAAAALATAVAAALCDEAWQAEAARLKQRKVRAEGVRADLTKRLTMLAEGLPSPAELNRQRTDLQLEAVRAEAAGRDGAAFAAAARAVDEQLRHAAGEEGRRVEVERLRAAVAALTDEVLRVELELNSPPRVYLARPAAE